MGGGRESRCVGHVYGANVVRRVFEWALVLRAAA